ncbi:unnamed protein product [Allacma fusca]|uniref:Uncharacterized protein n=1 Tax=Allacma fusca TaxID=39272 RepID=A0A8J2L0Z4_9HEXA|nr:unnamed protein product [Allacma fusca]
MIACHTFDGILGNVVTDPEERENSMEPFVCKCKYSAEDLSSLLQHVQNNHPYMLTKSPSMKRPRTLENSEGTEEPEILTKRPRKHGDGVPITFVGGWFRCEFCSYQNLLRDHVQRHIKRRKNDDVYRCSSCSYKSCSEHSLKNRARRLGALLKWWILKLLETRKLSLKMWKIQFHRLQFHTLLHILKVQFPKRKEHVVDAR